MEATKPQQHERAEIERVLRSGLFDKAPRLGRFFQYICDRHLEGNADQIKEYSIALEALGRGTDFDPKKDSIVRVEAHRLRKRLDDYYRGPGIEHPVHISIPNGQYRLQFLLHDGAPDATKPEMGADLAIVQLPELQQHTLRPRARTLHRWSLGISLLLLAVAATFVLFRLVRGRTSGPVPRAEEKWTAAGGADTPTGPELRILCGYHGPVYMDRQGHSWHADAFFTGGVSRAILADHYIEGQPDPHLLRSYRLGRFHYDIPLPDGTYELRLYFAETEYGQGNPTSGGEGTRTFDIFLNGQRAVSLIDPLGESGASNRLLERVFKDIRPASDGKLHILFQPNSAPPLLNAIELLPSQPGRTHPLRMVTQPNPVTDSDGRVWAADEYFCGGTNVQRQNVLLNPKERSLFHGERFGNFSYRIPLAPGKYRLTLHFAEQWFGTPGSGMLPADSRYFDVVANGTALLRGFNVAAEAGGANRSVEKTFDGLQPNAQGFLLLEFTPIRNYAEVNAIEVVESD